MLGAGAIVEQNALRGAQMLIARATDTRVLDWRSVCAALWRGTPIEFVVEEGFERAMGFRADLDCAFGAMGPAKANDAETGSKSLLGMGALTRICSHNAALAGSIKRASRRLHPIVELAYRMGGDLPSRNSRCKLQTNNFARLAHRSSLRWHRSLPGIAKGAT
jgi:hypothetical protein